MKALTASFVLLVIVAGVQLTGTQAPSASVYTAAQADDDASVAGK